MRRQTRGGGEAGFSLIELMVALGITLVIMTMASKALMQCFNVRAREDGRTAAIADVHRALSVITREVGSAGYGLDPGVTNGVVGCNASGNCDSNIGSIRVRSNHDRFDSTPPNADTNGTGEDVMFYINETNGKRYLVRYDANAPAPKATVLANRVDALQFHYYDRRVSYTTALYNPAAPNAMLVKDAKNAAGGAVAEVAPVNARYVVIAVAVRLPAVGRPGTSGYQPETQEILVSDVALRNTDLNNY